MTAFILRRIGQAVLVMLTVGLIAFSLFRFVGDPVTFMLGQDATPEQRVEVTRALGLDQPFYVQYLRFIGHALQGVRYTGDPRRWLVEPRRGLRQPGELGLEPPACVLDRACRAEA